MKNPEKTFWDLARAFSSSYMAHAFRMEASMNRAAPVAAALREAID
jgi:hypothetical protein